MHLYHESPTGAVARARSLRRDATDAEKLLWRALRWAFPLARFRRQVPVGVYFADFLSFGTKLVVEVDGGQHVDALAYDARRTALLESKGYRVLRFWNNKVLGNIDGVLAVIAQSLSHREREGAPEARKGEGNAPAGRRGLPPSPSHSAMPSGPLPLPVGEGL